MELAGRWVIAVAYVPGKAAASEVIASTAGDLAVDRAHGPV